MKMKAKTYGINFLVARILSCKQLTTKKFIPYVLAFIIMIAKKNCSKIHSYEKQKLTKRRCNLFFPHNPVGSLYPIRTLMFEQKFMHKISFKK